MPLLSNAKHETYCQAIVNGLNQTDAYEAAGYQRSPTAASQLSSRPEIQQRIAEITSERKGIIQELGDDIENLPSELNRDWLVKTLMKNVSIAQKEGQIAPANKAVEMLAELIGYSIKKPGAAAQRNSETADDDEGKPSVDMNRMADGIGKLGEILDRRDKEKAVSDE